MKHMKFISVAFRCYCNLTGRGVGEELSDNELVDSDLRVIS